MAAFTTTPTEAGTGPSVLNIAKTIGAKIRDAAEQAKEEREKAKEAGEDPKKGSLFKSSLANQFNPIKSKKAKSNWAKQFSWNKPKDKPVTPPTQADGQEGSAKLKEFIAGGFTAILKDTGVMVAKLGGIDDGVTQNLAASNRSAGTLTVIKETLDAQTDLRRKTLEEAKYARAEKKLEQTQDTSSVSSPDKPDKGGGGGDGEDGGGGPLDWIKNIFSLDGLFNVLGALDIASSIPGAGKFAKKLNPFKKSPVTQGGKPPSGGGPRVTTSGGASAPKPGGGGNWFKKLLPFGDDAAKGGAKLGAKGAGGLLGRILPGAQTALGIGLAAKSFADGDTVGGLLNLGSALPGPFGWAFLAASLGRDVFAPGLGNKELEQAFSTPGLTPEQTQGMSGLERGLLDISTPSFTGFSQGGIVPLARGGVVDNPTKTTLNPGDSVIPLNRNVGKQMLGDKNQATPGETAVDTVGAMILGVASGMLGKTESGTAGDAVKQNIRKASKQFGISNLTFTSNIGKAQFGKVTPNKDAKDFMMMLLSGLNISGGDGEQGKKGGGGGGDNPPGGTPESLTADLEADIGKDASQMRDEIMQSGATGIVDPTQQPWCAAYVNSQLKRSGIQGSGSAAADSFEDWGAPVDKNNIQYGDVLVGDYGAGSRSHVMFAAGSPKNGVVEIIGGNQSGKVTRGTISLDKIDYARRAGSQPPSLPSPTPSGQQPAPTPTAPSPQPGPNPGNNPAATNLPEATKVSPLFDWKKAQDGMVGKKQRSWWDFGGRFDDWMNNARENATLGGNKFGGDRYKEQMKELGYQGGGANRRPNYAKSQKAARIKEQQASVDALNSKSGLNLKGAGLGTDIGRGYPAVYKGREAIKVKLPPGGSYEPEVTVGGKRFFAVKQGDSVIYVSHFKAGQKNLGVGTKPPQAPKPKPTPPASPAGGVGPAPSATPSGAAATVITPPVQPASTSSFSAGRHGGKVPQGRSMAATFADFLYADLIE